MNKLAFVALSLLLASQAMAQAVVPNAPEPAATAPATVPAPAVPTPSPAPAVPQSGATLTPAAPIVAPAAPAAPVVEPISMAPAGAGSSIAAPASTTQQIDLNGMLGKLAGNTNKQQQLGQVLVVGSILGCTQKAAGKPATDAFYQQMQGVGKNVEALCKQGNATAARQTVLSTLSQKHNDPVVTSMLTCYDQQKGNVAQLGGQQVASDAAHYARWLKEPQLASAEMQPGDVCRNSKK